MGELHRLSADEFARRLKELVQDNDKHFAFFIGAGCSVSSKISAADKLVKDNWLPRLHKLCAPDRTDIEAWATEHLGYDPKSPAASYGKVIEELFLTPDDRQREIEKLCDGKFPGFGYAVLANLIAQKDGRFNVVLTTNFDDMVSDALYLYTEARPLVVQHESLADYIRPTRTRPLVVKVHGDHRLSPYNTPSEVKEVPLQLQTAITSLLHDRGLIFLGYGGADEGIRKMLESLPSTALPRGVFWVSASEPQGEIRPWLEERKAYWVEKGDFDEMMLLVNDAFELAAPNKNRFDEVFQKYFETYEALTKSIGALPDSTPDAAALKSAVKSTNKTFKDLWAVEVEARRLTETDPDAADAVYTKGIKNFPTSAPLLGNYANFLYSVRKDFEKAEEYYKRAIEADPNYANALGNYAVFLHDVRKDFEKAEEYYKRALEADPNHANTLGCYAFFLWNVRKDYDKAEEYYKRVIEADPNAANVLGNCAGMMLAAGKISEGAEMLNRVFALLPLADNPALAAECWFYALANLPCERHPEAIRQLKHALKAGARSPGWDLSANIARARKGGHAYADWLEKLASVISDGTDISILDGWPEWKKAAPLKN